MTAAEARRAGRSLSDLLGAPADRPLAYRRSQIGDDFSMLLDRARVVLLLASVRADGSSVTGDLELGFTVSHGSRGFRCGFAVVPVSSLDPCSANRAGEIVELRWRPENGYRLTRRFLHDFATHQQAVLAACCLWSRSSTGRDANGRGAAEAVLIDVVGHVEPIVEAHDTCGYFDAAYAARLAASAVDAFEPWPPTAPTISPAAPSSSAQTNQLTRY